MLLHQGIPLSQFMSCPICLKTYNEKDFRPISLACGHSVCKACILSKFGDKKCPFDQAPFPADSDKLPANYALMQVIGATIPERDRESPPSSSSNFPQSYLQARHCIEQMAVHLKPLAENSSDDETTLPTPAPPASSVMSEKSVSKCVLSRPIQRKLISLIHCQLLEEDGRSRSARIARSIGERIVTELLSLQQYSQQLSANLWAAVRTRGCQFLGPAMQEEVLKLILLALEDGSFLSRKVLVLFVVQRLESRYPQASKTAIGHVVQLLYRASCFKVLKRDEASSLMQLRDEFRQYEALRKEHDAQIVQMALEAGLRIPPEHWSSLLYGDSSHKSHMQSIIDKHQSAQSFVQCIAELMSTLQRNGDPCNLLRLQPQFEFISGIDPSPDCPAPSWENLEAVMRSLNTVMKAFIGFLSGPDHRMRLESMAVPNTRYKTSMCRDFSSKGTCPRGSSCTFAHSQDEMEKHRVRSRRAVKKGEFSEKLENAQSPEMLMLSTLTLNSTPSLSDSSMIISQTEASVPSSSRSSDSLGSDGLPFTTPVSESNATKQPTSFPTVSNCNFTNNSSNLAPVYKGRLPAAAAAAPLLRTPPSADVGPSPYMPATRLTFSEPAKEVPELPFYPPMGPQTSLHPHNPSLMGHGGTYVPPGLPPAALATPPHPSHPHQPWLDPHKTGHRPVHPSYKPLDAQAPLVYEAHAQPNFQRGVVSPEHYGLYRRAGGVEALSRGDGVVVYPCANCQPQATMPRPLSHSVEHQREPVLPPVNEVGHVFVGNPSQDVSLEDLTSRKKEIISHLQEEPTFLDPMAQVYRADSAKGGFDGLKTVLGKNMKKREAMPKLVSDMFVATRSTQSLDMFMFEEPPAYQTQWSTGEDGIPEKNNPTSSYIVTTHDSPNDDLSSIFTSTAQEAACPYSSFNYPEQVSYTSQDAGTLYNSLGSSMECSGSFIPPHSGDAKSMASYDSEFSRFPNDDDESFIPFEHTSVSKFGPISRMARAKTNNCAPVQVTADSSKRLTPVLAVTPLERPLPISMPVTSRFSSVTAVDSLMAEPSVKPTPTEAPSIWQESPQPSYMNIARLKAGAAGAISNNERLAYELQAVELQISMKTGKDPEPVGKIIHEAVMGNLPASKDSSSSQVNPEGTRAASRSHDSGSYCNSRFGDMGLGHVTDCLTMIEHGRSVVSSEQAAQHIMEEYYRSCQGLKK